MMFWPWRSRRGRFRGGLAPWIARLFYLDSRTQTVLIIISGIVMAGLIFSGVLLFRQSDHGDLMTRGQWLMKQGKAALAVQAFESMTQRYPGSYEAHLALGKAYMEIEEPTKAAREFRVASRIKVRDHDSAGAHVAISHMLIAQENYSDAEHQLFQALKERRENRKNPELRLTLIDLYENWGDSLLELSPPDTQGAFLKYSAGLRYVWTLAQEKPLRDKMISSAKTLADIYDNEKAYEKAIAILKRTLKYERNVDNMVAIAAMYEKKDDLDQAITWCREAYEIEPKAISLKLSSLLLKKGQELTAFHRAHEAEALFAEARQINGAIKLPLDRLYPVSLSRVDLNYSLDSINYQVTPSLTFTVNNQGVYSISYLAAKVRFMAAGETLTEVERVVATSTDPLASRGEPRGLRSVEFKPPLQVPLEDLTEGKIQARVYVRYSDDATNGQWYEVKNAERVVPEAARLNGVNATREANDSP